MMGRNQKKVPPREARSESISDAGARSVSLKAFDVTKLTDKPASDPPIVHAARVDPDGSRVAVATSDGFVRIIGIQFPDISYKVAELEIEDKDEGRCNVWDVAWGSTQNFGSVLAACSQDRKVRIWRESGEEWQKWFEWSCVDKAGNTLRWAPTSYGGKLSLAVGCSDGSVIVMKHLDKPGDESGWTVANIPSAHANGVTVITWGPARRMSKTPSKPPPLLITGGADSFVKMWIPTDDSEADNGGAAWERESKLEGHQDWITDLAWAPSVGVRVRHMLASAGRDRKVILWTQPSPSAVWVPMLLTQARDTPWSLSFSITGHMLTVAEADGRLTLWRENQGNWEEARFTKKIRDYHENLKAASALVRKEREHFESDAVSASGESAKDHHNTSYSHSESASGYKPEDYAAWAAAAAAANPGYSYADYYAYYAKYAGGSGHERDYYGGDRSGARYNYPYYPVDNTPQDPYRNRKPSETRGYDDYDRSRDKYDKYRYRDY